MQGRQVEVSNQERQWPRQILRWGPAHQIQRVSRAEPEHEVEVGPG